MVKKKAAKKKPTRKKAAKKKRKKAVKKVPLSKDNTFELLVEQIFQKMRQVQIRKGKIPDAVISAEIKNANDKVVIFRAKPHCSKCTGMDSVPNIQTDFITDRKTGCIIRVVNQRKGLENVPLPRQFRIYCSFC